MIDYTKISDNDEVINLIKEREILEKKIMELDNKALIKYELESLSSDGIKLSENCEYYAHDECDCIDGICHYGEKKIIKK